MHNLPINNINEDLSLTPSCGSVSREQENTCPSFPTHNNDAIALSRSEKHMTSSLGQKTNILFSSKD
jgi:hypothetical protein